MWFFTRTFICNNNTCVIVSKMNKHRILILMNPSYCHPWGRQRLLSACVSIWTESHKICKAWALINHVLWQCFRSYWLWFKSQIIESSTSISTSQLILTNRYQWINFIYRNVDFHPVVFWFRIIHHNSIFSTHVRRVLLFK